MASGLLASGPGQCLARRIADLIRSFPGDRGAAVGDLAAGQARTQLPGRFAALLWVDGPAAIAEHEDRLTLHNLSVPLLPGGVLLAHWHPALSASDHRVD